LDRPLFAGQEPRPGGRSDYFPGVTRNLPNDCTLFFLSLFFYSFLPFTYGFPSPFSTSWSFELNLDFFFFWFFVSLEGRGWFLSPHRFDRSVLPSPTGLLNSILFAPHCVSDSCSWVVPPQVFSPLAVGCPNPPDQFLPNQNQRFPTSSDCLFFIFPYQQEGSVTSCRTRGSGPNPNLPPRSGLWCV